MDADRFDAIAKTLITHTSRRRTLGGLVGAALVAIRLTDPDEASASTSRKCKPKCGECRKCQKGDCKMKNGKKVCKKGKCKPQPNGTACSVGTCQNGGCICPFVGLRGLCADAGACCTSTTGTVCARTGGCRPDALPVCCKLVGATCIDSCDCCGLSLCTGGICT